MEQYFLVTGRVRVKHYMRDGEDVNDVSHLVVADSEAQAEEKFRAFYESKTHEYDVYYSVYGCDVQETIR